MTIRKARQNDDTLHRLEDIETEEVSVVDNAANKRKFLVVKNSEESNMPIGPEVVEGSNGFLTTRAPVALTSEIQKSIVDTLSKALEGLGVIVEAAKGAEIVKADDEIKIPDEMMKSITEAVDSISGLEIVKARDEDKDKKPRSYAGGSKPKSDDDVSKANGLLTELEGFMNDLKANLAEAKRAPQDAPNTQGPNVGSGVQPDTSVVSDAASTPGLADLMKSVETLTKSVGELNGLKSTVSKQASDINALRSGVGLPASETPAGVQKGAEDVAWPSDMNAKKRDY